jgi:hypothetical protein
MELTLTKRGQMVLGILFLFGLLAMMGIAGAVETQDEPTCADFQASQDWESAWQNDCPFTDSDGNYLYQWEAN